jgi:acyl-CoA thioester hydrolase
MSEIVKSAAATPQQTASTLARAGEIRDGAHYFLTRVYYEDTDAAGIVYYANYLKFAERARTEMLRLLGIGQERLRAETGLGFAVRRCNADYRLPARLDDELEVETRPIEVRGASLDAVQTIRRSGVPLVVLQVVLACIGRDGRPARLPAAVTGAVSRLLAAAPSQSSSPELSPTPSPVLTSHAR